MIDNVVLKDIFQVEKTPELKEEYDKIYKSLKDRLPAGKYGGFAIDKIFDDYRDVSSYARRTKTGKIKDGITLSELELSMVCDGGYSHFGGSSSINGRSFKVVIYTD